MDTERTQRRDIDTLSQNTVSMLIDESRGLVSPISHSINTLINGDNWIYNNNIYTKYALAEDDKISVKIPKFDSLLYKQITDIKVGITITTNAKITSITLGNEYNSKTVTQDILINGTSELLCDCELFNYTDEEISRLFNEESTLTIGFNGTNNECIISELKLWIYHIDRLQDEIDVVKNRLNSEGGGGNVPLVAVGYFTINEQGHLIVELPTGMVNPYYINENGHLIYNTSATTGDD